MDNIEQIPVSSSNITAVGYDQKSQTLRTWFTNGSIYDYFDVPIFDFEDLKKASSVGSYLSRNIKGKYICSKVN